MKTCPPCSGDCNQGRECPARAQRGALGMFWLWFFAAMAFNTIMLLGAAHFGSFLDKVLS